MKHVSCIDDDKFNLFEGYVMDNYKNYADNYLWEKCEDENHVHNLGIFKTENIFYILLEIKSIIKKNYWSGVKNGFLYNQI